MAGIDTVLPEGACVVSVMHMVNPATFWVSEPLGHDMTEARGQLQALEESLQAHCRHVSFYKQGCYMPEQGEMVAVEHPKTHRWHRGRVEGVLNMTSGFVYKLFLVDHGAPLQVRSSSIQELPESCASLDYQAVQVVIYGVVPVTRQLDYEYSNMKTTVLDHWTAAAVRYVRELLHECVKAFVVKYKNSKHMIYGDLYLELENGVVISLKEELCHKEYAIFNEELFEKGCEEDGICSKMASSTDGCSSHDLSPCRSPRPDSGKAERRNIREYLNEYNDKKKMKEMDTLDKIKEWRQYNKLFEQESENVDEDEPVGRGIPIRRRPQVTPGGMVEKRQNKVKQTSDQSLLDLLDMMCGTCEEAPPTQTDTSRDAPPTQTDTSRDAPPTQTDTCRDSHSTTNPPQANKSMSYMPAGAAIVSTPKTKTAYSRNKSSFSQQNFDKIEAKQSTAYSRNTSSFSQQNFDKIEAKQSTAYSRNTSSFSQQNINKTGTKQSTTFNRNTSSFSQQNVDKIEAKQSTAYSRNTSSFSQQNINKTGAKQSTTFNRNTSLFSQQNVDKIEAKQSTVFNRNKSLFSQQNVNKTEQLKSTGNSEKLSSVCSNNIAFQDISENNKNPADSTKMSTLPIPDNEHLKLNSNSTDDGKAETLKSDNKVVQESVGLVTPRSMSLFERLQEKVKNTNRNGDGVMQKIMDGVIKSSQSNSQLQPSSMKSLEQGSGTRETNDCRLKTMNGLMDLMDMLDGLNPA